MVIALPDTAHTAPPGPLTRLLATRRGHANPGPHSLSSMALKNRFRRARCVTETPTELRYSKSHEWVRIEGDVAVVGITDHAQQSLNDIVYVELPAVGDSFETEDGFGVVESVKSVSDLYMPLAGEVIAVNDALEDAPETLNEDPYGAGWLLKLRMRNPDEVETLMDADGYMAMVAES